MDQRDNPSEGSRRTADPAAPAACSPLPSGFSKEAERGGAEERAKQQSESERSTESHLPSLEGLILDDGAADAERLEKINKLKKAIAGGTYHVSAAELARKLIEHMREPKPKPKG
jgi:anti-sigma28 factor (negative regulator of flagellin synthesis)